MGKGKNVDKLGKPAGKKLNPNVSDDNPVEFAKSLENIGKEDLLDCGVGQEVHQLSETEVHNENEGEVRPVVENNSITPEQIAEVAPASDKAKDMAARVMALVEEGKTMTEAMEIVMKDITASQTVAGRTILDAAGLISRMKGETNIEALKHKIKIAYAKKSKSQGKPAEAKYDEEIKAGQARLNELIKECELVEDSVERILKYMSFGESTGTVLQMILKHLEGGADKRLEAVRSVAKMTVKSQKEAINQAPATLAVGVSAILTSFGKQFEDLFLDRFKRNDVRCITLNKEYNFLETIEALLAKPTVAKEEAAAGTADPVVEPEQKEEAGA